MWRHTLSAHTRGSYREKKTKDRQRTTNIWALYYLDLDLLAAWLRPECFDTKTSIFQVHWSPVSRRSKRHIRFAGVKFKIEIIQSEYIPDPLSGMNAKYWFWGRDLTSDNISVVTITYHPFGWSTCHFVNQMQLLCMNITRKDVAARKHLFCWWNDSILWNTTFP